MIRNHLPAAPLALAIVVGGVAPVSTTAASASAKGHVHIVLPKPTTKPGDKCHHGVAGCRHGKFTGHFFGG